MITQKQSYDRISAAYEKGLTALVVELCEVHFRQFPTEQFALIWYAMAKTDLSQYAQAEKMLLRAISLFKGDNRVLGLAYKQMGTLSEAKGDLPGAAAWHRRALRVNPERDYHIFLGHIAFKRGLLNQAEAHYRKSIQHPASIVEEAYSNLGGVLVARRRYREAIKCYRKSLQLDPKYGNGIAKKRLKDAKLALQLLDS